MTYGRMPLDDDTLQEDKIRPRQVIQHRGDRFDFIARHRREAKQIVVAGRKGMKQVAPFLLRRIADTRTLRVAWDYLTEHGGQAPGLDGLRYGDIPRAEIWNYLRPISKDIRAGNYQPDPEYVREISKGPGRGSRPLVIQTISDRVVQRAVVEIVQPLLDPGFDPRSFGYRPRRGTLDALALAEHLFFAENRTVWVTVDLRDAFLRVSLPRLLQVVRKYLIADDLVTFIARVLGGAKTKGLRQGGSLSPLLLNLYLHHHLDRRWRQAHPDLPLLRYADDLLILCRTTAEATQAYNDLISMLQPTGMTVKEDRLEAVRTLTAKKPATWLGFDAQKRPERLRVTVSDKAWERLAAHLAEIQGEPNPQQRAVLRGWVSQMGPCYPDTDHPEAFQKIYEFATDTTEDIPGPKTIKKWWQRAYARWCRLRLGMVADLDESSLGGAIQPPCGIGNFED